MNEFKNQTNMKVKTRNPFTKFFHFCSGAIPEILELSECSTERIKYSCIGATVFFTAVMASISGGYAMYKVFGDQNISIPLIFRNDSILIPLSITFGIFWGVMIFNLDKYIVQSIRKEDDIHKQLLNALPRIGLAVLLSLVITKPLELKIFEREITSQLKTETDQIQKDEENNQEKAVITNEIRSLETKNKELNDEIKAKETQRNNAVEIARKELDGTGGSSEEGPGPIYKANLADASRIQGELDNLSKKNGTLIATNLNEIRNLNEKKIKRVEEVVEAKRKADGILGSLMALGKITQNNPTAFWIDLAIIALFISLETAPVFVKLVSKRGPYDAILEKLEEEVFIKEEENIIYIKDNLKQEFQHKLNLDNEARRIKLENFQNTIQQAQSSQEFMTAQAEAQSRVVTKIVERLSKNLEDSFSEDYFQTTSSETQQTNMDTKNQINEEIKKHIKIRQRIANFVDSAKKRLSNLIN